MLGSHRDGSNLALEVCSISSPPIGKLLPVAPLTGQSPRTARIGLWHARWGVSSALFTFLLCVCLPVLTVCRYSLRSLVIGRSIDQCPRLYQITMGPGSPTWAPAGFPSDALQQKVFFPCRDGDRTRFIAWLRLVSIHRYLIQRY